MTRNHDAPAASRVAQGQRRAYGAGKVDQGSRGLRPRHGPGHPHLQVGAASHGGEDVRRGGLGEEPLHPVHLDHLRGGGEPGRAGDPAPQRHGRVAPRGGPGRRGSGARAIPPVQRPGQGVVQPPTTGRRAVGHPDRDVRRAGAAGEQGGADEGGAQRAAPRAQRWTTGQVRVRVMPSTPCTFATTILPSSSTFLASARTITSYGPVTSSAWVTPLSSAISRATAAALPTSVWIRM